MKVKLRRQPGHNKKYTSYVITLPIEIIERCREIKKSKKVELETDFVGNIIIKPAD
ncbi:MAG TPA: hypothetical protein HA224_02950 [Nanoarchaeota archaeon]|nr:hypothetical protein [Nanoarchaeota archaeon]